MMEKETLDEGPKGGGKEELGEREWVSLNTLSLRKTKIWQDYLYFTRTQEGGRREDVLCVLEWRSEVYIVVVEKI